MGDADFHMQRDVNKALLTLDPDYKIVTDTGEVSIIGAVLGPHPQIISRAHSDAPFQIESYEAKYGRTGQRRAKEAKAESEKKRLQSQLGLGLSEEDAEVSAAKLKVSAKQSRMTQRIMRQHLMDQLKASDFRVQHSKNGATDPYQSSGEYVRELNGGTASAESRSTMTPAQGDRRGKVTLGHALETHMPSGKSPVAFSIERPDSPDGFQLPRLDSGDNAGGSSLKKKKSFFLTASTAEKDGDDRPPTQQSHLTRDIFRRKSETPQLGLGHGGRSPLQSRESHRKRKDSIGGVSGGGGTPGQGGSPIPGFNSTKLPPLVAGRRMSHHRVSFSGASIGQASEGHESDASVLARLNPLALTEGDMMERHNRLMQFQDVPVTQILAREAPQATSEAQPSTSSDAEGLDQTTSSLRKKSSMKEEPVSTTVTHTQYLLKSRADASAFYNKALVKVENRAVERRLKYWKKFKALSLTGPPLPFHATPAAILHHVEKVITRDERLSNRQEEFDREKAWFDQLRSYCAENYSHPTVQKMLNKAGTFIALDKPSPEPQQFFTHILTMVKPTEILSSDVSSACIHIGKVFNVPKADVIASLRKEARGFIADRTEDLGQELAKTDSQVPKLDLPEPKDPVEQSQDPSEPAPPQ